MPRGIVSGLTLLYLLIVSAPENASPLAVSVATASASSQPITSRITIAIPNGKPTAIKVNQAANKLYVAEGAQGSLLAFDGATHQLQATISISKSVYPDALIIDETYGRAYAASEKSFNSEFGEGSGLIYSINTVSDTLLSTFDPSPLMSTFYYTLAHDKIRHRVYLNGTGGLAYINIASNTMISIPLSGDIQSALFRLDEMLVNETTNTLYMLQDSYGYERLWILEINTGVWSYIDFPTLGARDPQHLAISETTNKVFVKVIQRPGSNQPGLYMLNRNNGTFAFIGEGDYGPMTVNETSNRLYTGVEVGSKMAIVEAASNQLTSVSMEGTTTGVGVRYSTDHAFLANSNFIALIDGASHTYLKIPVANSSAGGILVQDVAVHQATGWAYIIPDGRMPQVIAIQDLPSGPVQWPIYLPLLTRPN